MPHNATFIKRDLVLNMISHLGPISRTELIDLTDYRPASIGEITKELLDEGLIVETGSQSVGHGRKRVLLEINKDALYAVGVSFVGETAIFLVAQADGNILRQETQRLPGLGESSVEQICEKVQQLLQAFPNKRFVGIGIGEPLLDPTGYKREHSLMINYAHYNDWVSLGLKPRLEALTGLSVETYSGITLPAVAEQRFGVARGASNFICVELSNGVGSSICCNGVPVAGNTGVAGELGHMVMDFGNHTKLCYCGKPGCAEISTAFPALAGQIQDALDHGVFSSLKPGQPITVESLRRALEEGDRLTMHYVKQNAIRLGMLIANAVNLLNPELVVLYGFMVELGDFFLRELETSLRENVVTVAGDFQLRISTSQQTLLPLGAVAEIFASFLHSRDYRWIYQLQKTKD